MSDCGKFCGTINYCVSVNHTGEMLKNEVWTFQNGTTAVKIVIEK